ncbi:MAG: NAD-dependent epimerase/dehydratase family protein [Holophagaceae bacterium]
MRSTESAPGHTLLVGCGYVGARLARSLGGGVRALVRSPASSRALASAGILAQVIDLDDPQPGLALGSSPGPAEVVGDGPIPPPLDALVYLVPPAGPGSEDRRIAHFLQALGPARPQVFVYFSTTGVYGHTGGAAVDEANPAAPGDDRSRQRWDAEQRIAAWCGDRGVRPVVLRVPAIYGPHRLPLDRLQRGEPVLREEDSGPGNRIHVDDLVAACLAALERPVSGPFNLTDGAPESMAAFTTRVAAQAGLPAPRRVAWAEAQALLSPGLLAFLRESRLVRTRRAPELGWTPGYGNPDDGIRASLAEMGWGEP